MERQLVIPAAQLQSAALLISLVMRTGIPVFILLLLLNFLGHIVVSVTSKTGDERTFEYFPDSLPRSKGGVYTLNQFNFRKVVIGIL